jgi:histidyl-tRNA synthetase
MSTQKPSVPKGTRDFLPKEMIRRNYIFNTIRKVFEKYAYLPIETPAMENLSTLMGKYGEEGDRLLFKILNSGDFMSGVDFQESNLINRIAPKICEKGLRYDLTVPFARFVVQHRDKLTFPFKRYQMQPVWRADRPQKGRYREFYQCDVDVIGSKSLLQEVELLQITYEIFEAFQIPVVIKINNRKVLSGIAEIIGLSEKIVDICIAIDKMDKIGKENVFFELREREIPEDAISKIALFFDFSGTNEEKIAFLEQFFAHCEVGKEGIKELQTLFNYCKEVGIMAPELDITLARWLNYYTGAIFEVKATHIAMGSISGGGRYDNLTDIFGLRDMSGVGISYGAERIYDILNECNLFPNEIGTPVKALFLNFGETEELYALKALLKLRENNIASEIYPDQTKIGKQMNYANAKQIPYVIMAGEEEIKESLYTLKNMETGDQKKLTLKEIVSILTIQSPLPTCSHPVSLK